MFTEFFQSVGDSGPIYKETVTGRFPVEPFNTASNFIFLLCICYFIYLLYKSEYKHWFLRACMPVFLIGFIGGTVYHATRSSDLWLFMDSVPILVLCAACAVYFALRIFDQFWYKVAMLTVIVALNIVPRLLPIQHGYRISSIYIGMAAALLLPIFVYAYKENWRNLKYVLFAVTSFLIAVSFRTLDRKYDLEFLYMGTHWLWHTFGAIAVFCILYYIYLDKEKKPAGLTE